MKWTALLLTLFFSLDLMATEMVGALSAGQGGTGRASVEASESLYLNPASLALLGRFYSAVSYQSGFTTPGVSRNTYSVTLSDGSNGLMFPGSLGFRRHYISDHGIHAEENEFKGGLGYRLNKRISVGLGGSYLKAEYQTGHTHSQSNMDAGLLVGLLPNWGLSLSGENILSPDDNVPVALQRFSRLALGTQYILRRVLTFRYEALMPLHTENTDLLGHRFGLSVGMKDSFQLISGFSVDDATAQNWSSVGLAWRGPRLQLAYSFQSEHRSDLGSRHLIDLWFDI